MNNILIYVFNFIRTISISDYFDIFFVGVAIYFLLKSARETRAMQLLKGVAILLVLMAVSRWLHFEMINYLISSVFRIGILALIVIFQPEIRRFLDKLGRTGIGRFIDFAISNSNDVSSSETIDAICEASVYMSSIKCGALIVIENKTHLGEMLGSGTRLDSAISSELLKNIFVPNTPLHDGAVIIRGDRIVSAGCILPLTDKHNISSELGTRHRAALGMSETSDSIIVVVSEETGKISVAVDGGLIRSLSGDSLKKILNKHLHTSKTEQKEEEDV